MQNLLFDLKFVLRQLRKSPGFSITAVLMLAFGIGATTAIFSIVEGVLLRPLPFPDPGRVMVLADRLEGAGVGEAARVNAARMTAGIFSALAVQPELGRVFTVDEDEHSQQVVVLSYAIWKNRFNANPQILGTKILLDRKPYIVIGVMPRNFEFPMVSGQLNRTALWVPMSFTADELTPVAGANWSYHMGGRLKPGLSAAQAQGDAELVAQEIMSNYPPMMASLRIRSVVRPLQEETVEQTRPLLRTLFLAVAVVLLIACVNLA